MDLCCTWIIRWPAPGEEFRGYFGGLEMKWFSSPVEQAIHEARKLSGERAALKDWSDRWPSTTQPS